MKRFLTGANQMTRRDLLRFGGFGLLSASLTRVFKPELLASFPDLPASAARLRDCL